MAEETKYIEWKSYKPDKLSLSDWFIQWRSEYTHTEIRFSDRYGGISFSATMKDGCKCARFKMIGYSNPALWETILIPVTAEQEALIFAEACRMADVSEYDVWGNTQAPRAIGQCYYGPNALKYDLIGLLSFGTKWRIIRPHSKWVWCTEACLKAVQAGLNLDCAPDEHSPSSGHKLVKEYVKKAA